MGRPVTISIPHNLGKDEARRRIEPGFALIQQQLRGGVLSLVSLQQRWEGDRMHFEGGALGQKITGRIEVLPASVQLEVDLPELLAALAERIKAGLTKTTQKLLEKRG